MSLSVVRIFMLAGLCMTVGATAGCVDSHSIAAPRNVNPNAPVDIGPIVDERGVDVGPVVAARIRERHLGAARYVAVPGENPFVSGQIRVDRGNAGATASSWGSVTLMGTGIAATGLGGVLFVATSAAGSGGNEEVETVQTVGAVTLGIGLPLLVAGILLAVQPTRYREGKLSADLAIRRGPTSTPLHASDEATVRHEDYQDEEAGGPVLDGIANAISKETSK